MEGLAETLGISERVQIIRSLVVAFGGPLQFLLSDWAEGGYYPM